MRSDSERILDGVRDLYSDSLAEHGAVSASVGWRDEDEHRLRFDKLATVLEPVSSPFTVNDWGCGYGALFEYLCERGLPVRRYRGVDISEGMVDAATRRLADPRVEIVHGTDLSTPADFTFVSGTFNVRLGTQPDEWEAYVKDALRKLASLSRRGLAFNLLSTYVDWQKDHLFYGDPLAFFDFCKRELTPDVALLHDYPLYEWTMVVRFDRR